MSMYFLIKDGSLHPIDGKVEQVSLNRAPFTGWPQPGYPGQIMYPGQFNYPIINRMDGYAPPYSSYPTGFTQLSSPVDYAALYDVKIRAYLRNVGLIEATVGTYDPLAFIVELVDVTRIDTGQYLGIITVRTNDLNRVQSI